jgi:hypothetical protein
MGAVFFSPFFLGRFSTGIFASFSGAEQVALSQTRIDEEPSVTVSTITVCGFFEISYSSRIDCPKYFCCQPGELNVLVLRWERPRLVEVDRLFREMARVMEGIEIGPWLAQPNPAFDSSTPLEVIERGELDRIWRMVYDLESGLPGSGRAS